MVRVETVSKYGETVFRVHVLFFLSSSFYDKTGYRIVPFPTWIPSPSLETPVLTTLPIVYWMTGSPCEDPYFTSRLLHIWPCRPCSVYRPMRRNTPYRSRISSVSTPRQLPPWSNLSLSDLTSRTENTNDSRLCQWSVDLGQKRRRFTPHFDKWNASTVSLIHPTPRNISH